MAACARAASLNYHETGADEDCDEDDNGVTLKDDRYSEDDDQK